MKNTKSKVKHFFILLISPLFIPHILCYLCSKNKQLIREDIDVMNLKIHLHENYILSLIFHLWVNKYYRNIFYSRIGIASKIFLWYMPISRTFFLSCNKVGGGVYPAHPFSTILYAKSIGKNFSFRHNTTLGNKRDGSNDCPTIGDNVTLGANVCIIGDVLIGDNVVIGAGTVVTKNVPNNAIVVGNPQRIIGYTK